ncbi:MAG: NADH-quinone oxidoreductase subunit C [Bryobacteraceae bacterium]
MSQININHPAVLETVYALGETTLIADAAQIVSLCQHLKNSEGFNRLDSITALDHHPAEPRFEVVYHLHSVQPAAPASSIQVKRIRIRCRISGTNPEIDSVFGVWRSSDWYERETFDMFGIGFRNHPKLIRILLPLDWEGHPLRKDYPTHGYKYSYKGGE